MQPVSTIISFIWPFTFYLFIYLWQFLDQDRIVTASSTGAVTIYRHHPNTQVWIWNEWKTPITPIFNSLLSQCKQKQNSFFIKVAAQLICLPSSLQTLSVSQHWARAHRYPCDSAPCTSVVCSSPEIVTVGEDGRIVVFRADHEGVVQTIGKIRRGI